MKFGLEPEHFQLLDELCLRPLKNKGARIWIFGSRARGNHRQYSDIDLLYEINGSVEHSFVGNIEDDLVESRIPYKVDLVNVKDLAESYKPSVMVDRREL